MARLALIVIAAALGSCRRDRVDIKSDPAPDTASVPDSEGDAGPPAIRVSSQQAQAFFNLGFVMRALPPGSRAFGRLVGEAPEQCWPGAADCRWRFEYGTDPGAASGKPRTVVGSCSIDAHTGVSECAELGKPLRVVGNALDAGAP